MVQEIVYLKPQVLLQGTIHLDRHLFECNHFHRLYILKMLSFIMCTVVRHTSFLRPSHLVFSFKWVLSLSFLPQIREILRYTLFRNNLPNISVVNQQSKYVKWKILGTNKNYSFKLYYFENMEISCHSDVP